MLPRARSRFVVDAVTAGGGEVVDAPEAEALVWTDHADPAGLGRLLDDHPQLGWVQLPWAGVEPYVEVIRAHDGRVWTCGKGVYAAPVAEHALALALAGMRRLDRYARERTWTAAGGRNLIGARATLVGGGGIAEELLGLLAPFGCDVTVVRRRPAAMAGAQRVVGSDALDEALTGAELVVLALALVPDTARLIDRRRLDLLAEGACLVNVARGGHVVTDDLVAALRAGRLGSAGLDVTDPEPLPDGHPLWTEQRALVTPHRANYGEAADAEMHGLFTRQIRRWIAGEELSGSVDPARGY